MRSFVDISCSAVNTFLDRQVLPTPENNNGILFALIKCEHEKKSKKQFIVEVANNVNESARILEPFLFLCGRVFRVDTQALPGPKDCWENVTSGAETKTINEKLLVDEFALL